MSNDLSTLGIAIDSSEAVQAASDLDKLTAAGTRAESSANKTGGAWSKAVGAIASNTDEIVKQLQQLNARQQSVEKAWESLATAATKSSKATDDSARSTANQSKQIDSLLGKIDPLTKKLNELAALENDLVKARDSGQINLAAYESYNKKLQETMNSLSGVATSQKEVGSAADASKARLLELAQATVAAKQAQIDASNAALENAASVKSTGAAYSTGAKSAVDFNNAQNKASDSSKTATKTLESQDAAVTELLHSIDPLTKKLNDLDNQEQELKKHRESGRISTEVWADYQSKIDATRATLTRFDDSLTRTGNTAKQTAAALRGVPAQFTDIIVSLQGGQAPLTVLLQQGGQLKDMFGGVGNAAKALGGYVLGLINPFTLLAAALAVVGLAYQQGSKEQTAYNNALITTGNYAGTSSGALATMAKSISGTIGTTGAAAEVLAQLADTGKLTSASFEQIAKSALLFQSATGKAASETIAEFVKIADDPVKAIGDLDDKYHFLTASIYQQIVALNEQGDKQGAATLAENAYAQALEERAQTIRNNLGFVEKAWEGVKNVAKNAWDAMLNIGREDTLDSTLTKLKIRLQELKNLKDAPLGASDNPDMIELGAGEGGAQAKVDFQELQIEAEKYKDTYIGNQKQMATVSRQNFDELKKQILDTESNEDKRGKALLKMERDIAQTRADGYKVTATEEARLKKNIEDKFKDPKEAKVATPVDYTVFNDAENKLKLLTSSFDNAMKELDSLQKGGLISAEDYTLKRTALVTQEKDNVIAAYNAEIGALEIIKARSTTNGNERVQIDQKIADARANMVKATEAADSKLKVIATEEQGRLNKQTEAVKAYSDALNEQVKALQLQGARNAAAVGMGASQKAIFDQLNALTDKINTQRLNLASQYGDGSKGMSLEEYTEKLKALETAHTDMSETIVKNSADLKRAQSDWTNGAKSAFQDYIDSANDIAGQTKSAFTNAFNGLEDVFTKFITTGKLSFKDFADSVIADLARIVVKQQIIAPLLQSVFGNSNNSSGGGSSAGSLGGGTGTSFTDILSYGKTAVQLATSSIGSAAIAGFNSGSGLVNSLQSGGTAAYNSIVGSVTGNTAAIGGSQAGYSSSAISNWAANGGSSAVSGSAGGAGAGAGAGLSAGGAALYGIGGAIMGYQQAGLKGAATGAGGAVGGAYAGAAIGSVVPLIGTAIGAAIGAVLGGMLGSSVWAGDWVTKNQGIQLGVNDGELQSNSFEYQKKKGGLFGSNKKRTKIGALDDETQTQLDTAYDNVQTSVEGLFKTIGVKINDAAVDGIDVGILQISTKDNTPEQVQEKITAWFGTVADAMVGAINTDQMTGLENYNFESLTVFVNNLTSVDQVLKNLNVKVFDFSIAGGKMAEQLSALSGGLESLTANSSTYYDKFFSDSEKSDDLLEAVGKQFEAVNVKLPATRAGFRAAVEGLDLTTEAGRTMFATLIALSGNAAQAYDILEQRATAAQAAAEAAAQAAEAAAQARSEAGISKAQAAFGKLQRSIAAEQAAAQTEYQKQTDALNILATASTDSISKLKSIGNALSSALSQIIESSDTATAVLRKQAVATLDSALATVKAGGMIADDTALQDALNVLSKNDTSNYASANDYNIDQGVTANKIDELKTLNDMQLTTEEKTLAALQSQLKLVKDNYDIQASQYQSQLDFAQSQLDALNGVDNSITSVTAAVNAMGAAVVAAISTLAIKATSNTPQNNATLIDSIYQNVLGRPADDSDPGKQGWADLLNNGTLTYDQIATAIAQAAIAFDPATYTGPVSQEQIDASKAAAGHYLGLPGYAMGTGATTASGWMTVGEQGPELINTGPVTIKSNAQSKAFMKQSDEALANRLDNLLEYADKQNAYLYTIAKNSTSTANDLDDINDRQMRAEA